MQAPSRMRKRPAVSLRPCFRRAPRRPRMSVSLPASMVRSGQRSWSARRTQGCHGGPRVAAAPVRRLAPRPARRRGRARLARPGARRASRPRRLLRRGREASCARSPRRRSAESACRSIAGRPRPPPLRRRRKKPRRTARTPRNHSPRPSSPRPRPRSSGHRRPRSAARARAGSGSTGCGQGSATAPCRSTPPAPRCTTSRARRTWWPRPASRRSPPGGT